MHGIYCPPVWQRLCFSHLITVPGLVCHPAALPRGRARDGTQISFEQLFISSFQSSFIWFRLKPKCLSLSLISSVAVSIFNSFVKYLSAAWIRHWSFTSKNNWRKMKIPFITRVLVQIGVDVRWSKWHSWEIQEGGSFKNCRLQPSREKDLQQLSLQLGSSASEGCVGLPEVCTVRHLQSIVFLEICGSGQMC